MVDTKALTAKAKLAAATKAKALLKSAAGAAKQLESDITELVTMRAWEILDAPNFSEMWLRECGFNVPRVVLVIGVLTLESEGMNTTPGRWVDRNGRNGHTSGDIARMLGMPSNTLNTQSSKSVLSAIAQIKAGVPLEEVRPGAGSRRQSELIGEYGNPTVRKGNRQLGAGPEDLVPIHGSVARRDKDSIERIAREANVNPTAIVRQAILEYLLRIEESRKPSTERKISRPSARRAAPSKVPGFWPYGTMDGVGPASHTDTEP